MTTNITRQTCDRCGKWEERKDNILMVYPPNWQYLSFGQTGAKLDLCATCNEKLAVWLSDEGADNMRAACVNDRELL